MSSLGDKTKHNGRVPSALCMNSVHKKMMEEQKVHSNNEIKKLSLDIMSIDGSHKVTMRLFRHNRKRILNALMTEFKPCDQM